MLLDVISEFLVAVDHSSNEHQIFLLVEPLVARIVAIEGQADDLTKACGNVHDEATLFIRSLALVTKILEATLGYAQLGENFALDIGELAADVAGQDFLKTTAQCVNANTVLIELIPRSSVAEEGLFHSRSVSGSVLDLLLSKVAHNAPAKVEKMLLPLNELKYTGLGAGVDLRFEGTVSICIEQRIGNAILWLSTCAYVPDQALSGHPACDGHQDQRFRRESGSLEWRCRRWQELRPASQSVGCPCSGGPLI
jgi:hypothetical protein